ncbi:hypothetical protein PGT21_006840 [Puccinia graminis f. sp. tritici]|uniref:Uncharacterized protein n=1 Tax=Puccinia graminis f. sp. tritici TaxID=56615 RepID=A0A5B0NZ60_PUCGR|nr:hypothetical protein PGTUg99_035034 [Puccinia graminis f. sp. tritici]KAA1094032.1 hypothetical protein PGT21_006840 [Puccinia graminis f. sp. tritici]
MMTERTEVSLGSSVQIIPPSPAVLATQAGCFTHDVGNPTRRNSLLKASKKITQDNNGAPGSVPFTHLATLLNLSPNQPPPLIGDTPGSTVGKIVNEQPSALTVAQSVGALTAPINAESSSSAAEKPSNFKRNLSGEFKIRLKVMKRSEGNQNSGTQPNIEGQQNYNNIPKNDNLTPIGKGSES